MFTGFLLTATFIWGCFHFVRHQDKEMFLKHNWMKSLNPAKSLKYKTKSFIFHRRKMKKITSIVSTSKNNLLTLVWQTIQEHYIVISLSVCSHYIQARILWKKVSLNSEFESSPLTLNGNPSIICKWRRFTGMNEQETNMSHPPIFRAVDEEWNSFHPSGFRVFQGKLRIVLFATFGYLCDFGWM